MAEISANSSDNVLLYGAASGLELAARTVLVEGSTDVDLLELAARLEEEATGERLIGDGFVFTAAGDGDRGGVRGVVRELVILRGLSRTTLSPSGRPRYRFVGLLDNDHAGRMGVRMARELDTSIQEFKDLFRIHPAMPLAGNLDPITVRKTFEKANTNFSGLDWELEDLISDEIMVAFSEEYPTNEWRSTVICERVHRDFNSDCKAKLHRFVKQYAVRKDLDSVVALIRAVRHYLMIR